MNRDSFKAKFPLGILVMFDGGNNHEESFGFVRTVEFYQSDAVNYAASYSIEKCNGSEMVRGVAESKIIRAYSEGA